MQAVNNDTDMRRCQAYRLIQRGATCSTPARPLSVVYTFAAAKDTPHTQAYIRIPAAVQGFSAMERGAFGSRLAGHFKPCNRLLLADGRTKKRAGGDHT
eukprot:352987-Chlamydomonas_euryale.AAC.9